MSFGSDDDEMIIGDEDEDNFNHVDPDNQETIIPGSLTPIVGLCEAYLPDFEPHNVQSTIYFSIPKKYLPLSLQVSCGFYRHPIILNVSITLNFNRWNSPPSSVNIQNPDNNTNFVGSPLINKAISDFFSPDYQPRDVYKSKLYIFRHSGIADKTKLRCLVEQDFDPQQASEALALCSNNLDDAKQFLLTGKVPSTNSNEFDFNHLDESLFIPTYDECPFIYLILEIVEAFLDLNDHCCICRKKLPFSGIRPQHCTDALCQFGYNMIGVCSSVASEIRRDPLAADLVFSIFSASFSNAEFMDPKPSQELIDKSRQIFSSLPPMETIARNCKKDGDISRLYGQDTLSLLRWVLMTNRSQIISLPKHLTVQGIPTNFQFMTLISTPESELEFQSKKKQYGSLFLWHGSGGDRWHSILHNGLKNMSKLGKAIHGTACGEGIYLANNSCTSMGYSQGVQNLYINSKIGNNLRCIALCEVANMPSNILRNFSGIKTLIDEKACVVRFIFAYSNNFSIDTIANPLKKIPGLDEVVEYMVQSNK